jgi:hypothetical protein
MEIGVLDVGLVSIDIDGNDLPIISKFLEVSQPQVLCVEYKAKFPSPMSVFVPKDDADSLSHEPRLARRAAIVNPMSASLH